jgi:hypothetical protein
VLNYAVTANHNNLLVKDTGSGVIPRSMQPLAKRTATRPIRSKTGIRSHTAASNPDLPVPEAVVEEWISVGTFRTKEITAKPQQVVDWTFAEQNAPLIIKKSKELAAKAQRQQARRDPPKSAVT